MDIKEVIEKAVKEGKCITNIYYKQMGVKFYPTNTDDCIICIKEKSSRIRWQPKADDLINDTWEIVD